MLGTGTATLLNGAVTVSVPRIPSSAKIHLTRTNPLGTVGDLRQTVIAARSSFTIQSANVLDQSQVHWTVTV